MNRSAEKKDLFLKFIKRECSTEEVQQVVTDIKKAKKLSDVADIEVINDMLDEYPDMNETQADIIFSTIVEADAPSKKKFYFWKYAAAAILTIGLVSSYFFRSNLVSTTSEIVPVVATAVVIPKIEIGTDKAILTLENGDIIPLEKDGGYVADNAVSDGKELVYETQNNTKSEIIYNYLTIPRGGQFKLQLADGTKVWLNSETQLKFPVAFIKGETRKVELLYGEAYFDVSPSSDHNGSKFNVKTQVQDIEVLGTEFNIKAYKNSTAIYTTLVEGKVALNSMNKTQYLIPNQQIILNTENQKLTIKDIDVYDEISWKSGLFSFKGKSLKEIMIVLSRWYDIEFEFSNKNLENVKFNGVLLKKQSLEEILTIIKETKFINSYEVTAKKVILK
ncbi:FecR family protein [Flavobacterium sp. TAB 87]|uniref:FecR family protein n=1 Tax=Flavobacterium sp. TAB 87 TaxID=1729581 RepID=UPI00076CCCAC|nr:FecR family protein [Flavobacterium sp. TAB 87]KVV15622.1 fec operon regulator FecR [Flavobacterium sp. TAB 87]